MVKQEYIEPLVSMRKVVFRFGTIDPNRFILVVVIVSPAHEQVHVSDFTLMWKRA